MSFKLPVAAGILAAALACAGEAAAAPTWTEIPSGTTQNITALEYQSETRLWFTTAAGAIYTRQADGTFKQTRAPGGVPLNDIEFQAGGPLGFAVGNAGLVLRSDDAGQSWTAVTGIPVAGVTGANLCETSQPLGDVNAVRFAGNDRVWILGAGAQLATSQTAPLGATGTWRDANRDTKSTPTPTDDTCRVGTFPNGFADAFFAGPDVGYFVDAVHSSRVYHTTNNLASAAQQKPVMAGFGGTARRVLAGDPENPNRLWSVTDSSRLNHTMVFTRDGFQSPYQRWTIGTPEPATGPADVDYAGGTVLAAGDGGQILSAADGETFSFSAGAGPLATHRWNAAGLASKTLGAVAGDGGKLVLTSNADGSTPPPPPPPAAEPKQPDPPIITEKQKTKVDAKYKGTSAKAVKNGKKVKLSLKGALTVPATGACDGSVQVKVLSGKKVVATGTVKLGRTCGFSGALNVKSKSVGSKTKLTIELRYAGNATTNAATQNVTAKIKR